MPFIIDQLEGRSLMSAGAHKSIEDALAAPKGAAAVDVEASVVTADRLKYAADKNAYAALLTADRKAYNAANSALSSRLAPLIANLNRDVNFAQTDARSLNQQLAIVFGHYQAILADDHAAVVHANTQIGTASAQEQLNTDQAACEAAMAPIHRAAIADQKKIKSDRQAIRDYITHDPAVAAALSKYQAHSNKRAAVLAFDSAKLDRDRRRS